jgi:hypothetical protein
MIFAECSSNECTVDICLVESIIHFVFVELSAKLELVVLVTTALNLPL